MSLSFQASKAFNELLPLQNTALTPFPEYTITLELRKQFPSHQHVVLRDPQLPLMDYLKAQSVQYQVSDRLNVHSFCTKLSSRFHIGIVDFAWMNTNFQLFKFTYPLCGGELKLLYVLMFLGLEETDEEKNTAALELLTAAYKWSLNTREEIWLFSKGVWSKDRGLYEAIRSSERDSLVLQEEAIDGLKRDIETFFSDKEMYRSLGIPWKRGLLLLGPPGNGKTESIKVLLKETDVPVLYVNSFETYEGTEAGIRFVFQFARSQAPCILVLEDLDSMVVPEVRAFFLNELDGLEQNDGILTIATSNHPDKIDSAILNRPSPFNVKYTFDLPSEELRKIYVKNWMIKTRNLAGIEFSEWFMDQVVQQKEGYSFAHIKEFFVSFLMR